MCTFVPHMVEKAREISGGTYKGTNGIYEGHAHSLDPATSQISSQ